MSADAVTIPTVRRALTSGPVNSDLAENPFYSETGVEFVGIAYPSLARTVRPIVGANNAEDIVRRSVGSLR